MKNTPPIQSITEVLENEERVVFGYLYGSMVEAEEGNDIDIAVFSAGDAEPYRLSADLKIELHKRTGISPDTFDVRVINSVLDHGDVFDLLYLRNVMSKGKRLVLKDNEVLGVFLERYGTRFRECEGLIQEVLA